jgi:hypothetical protein
MSDGGAQRSAAAVDPPPLRHEATAQRSSLAPQKVQLPPNPMYQPPALPLAMSIAFSSAAPMIAVLFSNPFG